MQAITIITTQTIIIGLLLTTTLSCPAVANNLPHIENSIDQTAPCGCVQTRVQNNITIVEVLKHA